MKRRIRYLFLMILIFMPPAIIAQEQPDLSKSFNWDTRQPSGTLLHYEITQHKRNRNDSEITDYYLYYVDGARIETLHNETNLGIGEALWLDTWVLNTRTNQFERHLRKNLLPSEEQPLMMEDTYFDIRAGELRIQSFTEESVQSSQTEITWSPMVWQKDLGVWFLAFMPHLNAEEGPFLLGFDSWGKLIMTTVSSVGMDDLEGETCRIYSLSGQGVISRLLHKGTLWLSNDELPVVVRMEQEIPFSRILPRIQLQLVEKSQISYSQWQAMTESGSASAE